MRITLQSRTANGLIMDMVHEIAVRRSLDKDKEKRLLAMAARAYYEDRVPLNDLERWLMLAATTGLFTTR